jgi:hypothetical protein
MLERDVEKRDCPITGAGGRAGTDTGFYVIRPATPMFPGRTPFRAARCADNLLKRFATND